MQFLNPTILIGLAAASIPLLLHLLNLRRLKRVEFSSVVFLKELKKSRIRNVKLRQLLLLILRTLIIACVVLAFARPTVDSQMPGLVAHAPTSVVYILDNTFSMDIESDNGVQFVQGKRFVKETLEQLQQGDEVSFVLLSDPFDTRMHGPTRNPELAADWLQNVSISYLRPDMASALNTASNILKTAANINREIVIVTDAQDNTVPDVQGLQESVEGIAVYIHTLNDDDASVSNLSVDSVYMPRLQMRPDIATDVVVGVANHSNVSFDGALVSLFLDDRRVAQQNVDIGSNTSAYLNFTVTPNSGGINNFRVLVEGDALEHDNVRYSNCLVPTFPSVLFVRNSAQNADISYLETALLADGRDSNTVTTIAENQLGSFPLAEYDVVVLQDIDLSQQQQREVVSFVESGGGLLYFLGERVASTDEEPAILKKFGVKGISFEQFGTPARFTSIDKQNSLFTGVFKSQGNVLNEDPAVNKAFLFGDNSILSIGQQSLLTTAQVGRGQAIVFGVPGNGDWSRLPFTGVFVSLVNRSVALVSASPDMTFEALVGEPIRLQLPHGLVQGELVEVRDGIESTRKVSQFSTGTYVVLPAAKQPGVIALQSTSGEPVAVVNVNVQSDESRVSIESTEKLVDGVSQWFGSDNVTVVDADDARGGEIRTARVGTELWSYVLMLAVLLALCEMTIASRWK